MLFFNANFICYYFYPTKKREEPEFKAGHLPFQGKVKTGLRPFFPVWEGKY